jgi:AraC-like DNA-binding protein
MDREVGQHLLDLVSLCLGATGEFARLAARRGLASARLDAVKAQILRQLVDPNMRLQRIAASHELSTRYVQYLFGLEGTSFKAYVLEQRLLLAHRLLRDPATQWR